jgi:hypothetical protein
MSSSPWQTLMLSSGSAAVTAILQQDTNQTRENMELGLDRQQHQLQEQQQQQQQQHVARALSTSHLGITTAASACA